MIFLDIKMIWVFLWNLTNSEKHISLVLQITCQKSETLQEPTTQAYPNPVVAFIPIGGEVVVVVATESV